MPNKRALALPDALLIRYYRGSEIEGITKVTNHKDGRVSVHVRTGKAIRVDHWRDLGGGLGYVPDGE